MKTRKQTAALASTTLLLLVLLAGCAQLPPAGPPPLLVLVSLDGFRADYIKQDGARSLRALAAQGMQAESMQPSFPSTTFPNHYTIATGLRPDHHGVVGHAMEDAAIAGERFISSNPRAMMDRRWWDQAEPIWVTAEKAGLRTGLVFWPGSEAAIHGVLAHDYRKYDGKMSANDRVATALSWLDRPPEARPRLLALYLTDVDTAGHQFGPDSVEVTDSIARVDTALEHLRAGLRQRGIAANLVVVSDHGMTATGAQRLIRFNRLAPAGSYRLVVNGPYAGVDAMPGQDEVLSAALLKPQEHLQCWPKARIPARYHYGQNARVPQYICLADPGWTVVPGDEERGVYLGSHGYDNSAPDMQAIFIAAGPAFKEGVRVPAFSNVHVYSLLMKLLGRPALPSDGSLAPFSSGLRE